MSHVRQQLLDAITAALTGLATTGSNVFTDRPPDYHLDDSELPALRVYEDGDQATDYAVFAFAQQRTVQIRIELSVKRVDAAAAQLRQMALEVEAALSAGVTILGRHFFVLYRGVTHQLGTLERPVADATLNFEIPDVYIAPTAPDQLA